MKFRFLFFLLLSVAAAYAQTTGPVGSGTYTAPTITGMSMIWWFVEAFAAFAAVVLLCIAAFGFTRGWTHGVGQVLMIAMVPLVLVLAPIIVGLLFPNAGVTSILSIFKS